MILSASFENNPKRECGHLIFVVANIPRNFRTYSWELRKEHILENKLISIYIYKDPLKPRQSTDPLCSQIQISQISISKYEKLKDISFTITMYAEDENSECIIFDL